MGTVVRVMGGRQGNLAESWSLLRPPCISGPDSLILHFDVKIAMCSTGVWLRWGGGGGPVSLL